MIVTSAGKDNDDLEGCIICAGEINEKMANYITKLHNDSLK
jgi:hypothetical protein